MRLGTAQLAAVVAVAVTLNGAADAQTRKATRAHAHETGDGQTAKKRTAPPASLPCGDVAGFQVLLDRQGFSPGEIDGRKGPNFLRALAAFQSAHRLPAGAPDCATWEALGGASAAPTITSYRITDADSNGPFEPSIPPHLVDQAKLKTLEYRSTAEMLAERFHTSPAFLAELNKGAAMTPGSEIKVPAVTAFDPAAKPQPGNDDLKIVVSKEESALRATAADGSLVFYAPVSSGSTHDPLPPGNYKVRGVAWRPPFHYNPDLFWDAQPKDEKATIPPGPNNPVGVAWIALDLEHYGIHGTPEPGHVGHTESHGCVRLTNWDAARLASLVKAGTAVEFR